MRKLFLIGMLAVCLVAVAGTAFAEDYDGSTIVRLGVRSGQAIVQIRNADLPNATVFWLDPNREDEQLATLLTAFSMDKTVFIRTAGPSAGSIVQIVYVNQ